jgi:hypothetical protein
MPLSPVEQHQQLMENARLHHASLTSEVNESGKGFDDLADGDELKQKRLALHKAMVALPAHEKRVVGNKTASKRIKGATIETDSVE